MDALSILIKPASSMCNMACTYCFYSDVSSSREIPYKGIMSIETMNAMVKKAFEETKFSCSFAFQGGEPTLAGLDFYRLFVASVKKFNVNNIQTFFSIQTNGYILDDTWIGFLKDNNFLVGISLDGMQEINDKFRLDKTNFPTYNRTFSVIDKLKAKSVEFNILSVVTNDLALQGKEFYHWIKQNDFRYVQLIPCIDDFNADQNSLLPIAYTKFLETIFPLWYKDFFNNNYYSIRSFDNYVHLAGGYLADSCAYNGKCIAYPTIEGDGSVYPCDFYAIDKYYLGNIVEQSFNEIMENPIVTEFEGQALFIPDECQSCPVYPICKNGCYRDRVFDNNLDIKINKYCETYKAFFRKHKKDFVDIAKVVYGR